MQSQPNVSEPDDEAAWNVFVGAVLFLILGGALGACALIGLRLLEAAAEVFG